MGSRLKKAIKNQWVTVKGIYHTKNMRAIETNFDCCDFYGRGARCNAPDGFVCTNGYASAIIQKWLQSEAE